MVNPREIPWGAPPPRYTSACVKLRAKTQYYRLEDQEQPPGRIADSPSLSYWCALTQDHIGPDQRGCTPQSCQASRACYQAAPLPV